MLFLRVTLTLQRKIMSYHVGCKPTVKSAKWSEPLVLLAFNTNESIGQAAGQLLGNLTIASKPNRDLHPLVLQKAIDLCKDKLVVVSAKNQALEEGNEVVINQTLDLKLTKANRATYLESLARGLSRLCQIAAGINYFSDNLPTVLTKLAIVQQFGTVVKDKKVSAKLFEMILSILRSIDMSRYDPAVMVAALGGGKILTRTPEKYKQFAGKDIDEEFTLHVTMDEFLRKSLKVSAVLVTNKAIHWKNRVKNHCLFQIIFLFINV